MRSMHSWNKTLAIAASGLVMLSSCGSSGVGTSSATTPAAPSSSAPNTSASIAASPDSTPPATGAAPNVAAAIQAISDAVSATGAATATDSTVAVTSCPLGDPTALLVDAPAGLDVDPMRTRFNVLEPGGVSEVQCVFPGATPDSRDRLVITALVLPLEAAAQQTESLSKWTQSAGPLGGTIYTQCRDSGCAATWIRDGLAFVAVAQGSPHADMTDWLRAKIEPMVTALDGLDPLTMRRAPPTGS